MADFVTCPSCQRRLRLPAEYAGQLVQCPSCTTKFREKPAAPVPAAEPLPTVIPEYEVPRAPESAPRRAIHDAEPPPRPDREEDLARPRRARRVPLRRPSGSVLPWVLLGVFLLLGGGVAVWGLVVMREAVKPPPTYQTWSGSPGATPREVTLLC